MNDAWSTRGCHMFEKGVYLVRGEMRVRERDDRSLSLSLSLSRCTGRPSVNRHASTPPAASTLLDASDTPDTQTLLRGQGRKDPPARGRPPSPTQRSQRSRSVPYLPQPYRHRMPTPTRPPHCWSAPTPPPRCREDVLRRKPEQGVIRNHQTAWRANSPGRGS
jgi:hypothetical protein